MAGEGLNITLDSEAIRKMVTESVLAQIEPQQQKAIIESAVQQMLTPPVNGYSGRKELSPLQQAFNTAVNNYCHDIARTWLAQPEVQEKLRTAAVDALGKLLETNWSLSGELGSAIAKAIESSLKDS